MQSDTNDIGWMLCWTAGVLLYSYYNSVATTTDSLLDYYYSLHIRRACRAIACARSESTCLSRSTGSQGYYLRESIPARHDGLQHCVCDVSGARSAAGSHVRTNLPASLPRTRNICTPVHPVPFSRRATRPSANAPWVVWSFCVRQATVPGLQLLSPVKTGIADPEIF